MHSRSYFNPTFPIGDATSDYRSYYFLENDFIYDQANFVGGVLSRKTWRALPVLLGGLIAGLRVFRRLPTRREAPARSSVASGGRPQYPMEDERAQVVRTQLSIAQDKQDLLVLTHESGLEIFLIAAGVFVGIETSKFILKRVLEEIESRINSWWDNRQSDRQIAKSGMPLVGHILIRTPHWEITLDGTFSQAEREQIIAQVAATATPAETIEEFVSTIESERLQTKTLSRSRRIVRRQIRE